MQGRVFSCLLLFGFHTVLSEIFDVFGPDDPITVSVGEDVVLECQVVPAISLNTLEVRWFTSDSASPVHLYTGGQDRPDVQDKDYQGRTELFKDEFPRGNASLKLKKIKVSDEGSYLCYIDSKTHHDQAVIDLNVEEFGDWPWVHVEENSKGGLCVVCQSDGWYPEPLIHWVNGKGEDVTAQSETEFIMDSTGLITVQSRINVTSDSVNKFSCFMENQFLSKIQEAHLQISDEFFPRVSAWLVSFWVFVVLVIMAIAVDVMIHRKEDKKIKALGREHWIQIDGYHKNGIELMCESNGWFPQPQISWTDGNGQNLTAPSEINYQRDSNGLVNVQSSVTVTKDATNSFKYLIQNKLLKEEQEAAIQIAGRFMIKYSFIFKINTLFTNSIKTIYTAVRT
ncbi:butyrophilin subfamily 3 member A2-like [Hemiscyllium ocellatum]|uniref:butyrophilin subfamily 3 member A2-like n=1 Tax=Hemiscyllium ocellatum TaxID=170820 RepID=UPI002966439F|nr:butyrophilin subfamily 3 member A2-like [Hemiscyllium ocellatum]